MPVETDPVEEEQKELHGQMSFLDHLEELRQRLIRMIIAIAIGFAACWTFADELFFIVEKPILAAGAQLNMTKLTEGFNVEFRLAIVAAIYLVSPYLMSQVWLFISPGLYQKEKKYALPFVIFATLLFYIGGTFAYFIAFPFAVTFLIDWGRQMKLQTLISASEYFDIFVAIMLAMGVVFEIPAVIFVLSRIGVVSAGFLLRNFKYALLLAFVVAALITPTSDVSNMMVLAVPMIALYLLGVVVAFIFGKKKADA